MFPRCSCPVGGAIMQSVAVYEDGRDILTGMVCLSMASKMFPSPPRPTGKLPRQ